MITLSDLEADTLAELINIGMGRAAASLGKMVNEEIELSVPHLEFLSRREAARLLEMETSAQVSAVREAFSGPLQGTALLIFPQAKSLELVRALLREEVALEVLTELEQEALTEVGNIILNACLGALANMLRVELQCGLPEFISADCASLLSGLVTGEAAVDRDESSTTVILLIVDFSTRQSRIKGYVVLMVDLAAITSLQRELRLLIDRYQRGGE